MQNEIRKPFDDCYANKGKAKQLSIKRLIVTIQKYPMQKKKGFNATNSKKKAKQFLNSIGTEGLNTTILILKISPFTCYGVDYSHTPY